MAVDILVALVRTGCRIAEHRLANWTVVAFSEDTQVIDKQENSQSREIERALNLTRQLGGMRPKSFMASSMQKLYLIMSWIAVFRPWF